MKHNMREAETANVNPKTQSMNRRARRILLQHRHVRGTGRPSGKTGQPDWSRRMKWESERKRLLTKLPVSELAVHGICSAKQATALYEAGFKTVYAVASATYEGLLRVTGFGPKTLAKLWQDAKIKGQLDMSWKVPA